MNAAIVVIRHIYAFSAPPQHCEMSAAIWHDMISWMQLAPVDCAQGSIVPFAHYDLSIGTHNNIIRSAEAAACMNQSTAQSHPDNTVVSRVCYDEQVRSFIVSYAARSVQSAVQRALSSAFCIKDAYTIHEDLRHID